MRYEAILWDLDGTLLDTLTDLSASTNAALTAHGLPPRTTDEVRAFVGNGIRRLVERAVPADCDAAVREEVFADFCTHYEAHCRDNTRPYDGVLPLLRRLKQAGVRSAVVSNKADFAVKQLAADIFPDTIETALGATDTVPKKPAPDMVAAALSQLCVPRERALYVGDSEVDVATAAAAGMDSALVTWGFRSPAQLVAAGAQRLIDTVAELENWLFSEDAE